MKKKILLFSGMLLTSLLTTSCGYGLKEVYDGVPYNSPVYAENYYRVWDERVKEGSPLLTDKTSRELDIDNDKVFESYDDPVFKRVDKDSETLEYDYMYEDKNDESLIGKVYGPTKKLSRIDNSFKYGVASKLFDGQITCHSKYEIARAQIDETGFALIFDKEAPELDYFAMNFKGSIDHKQEIIKVPSCVMEVKIKVSFFCKNDKGYEMKTFTHDLETDVNGGYTFFGFKVDSDEIKRVQGISIAYEYLGDDLETKELSAEQISTIRGLQRALWVYELFLPNTIWR